MARILSLTLLTAALLVPAAAPAAAASPATKASDAGQAASKSHKGSATKVKRRNPVATAAAIAKRYWGAVPCAGRIKILAQQPLAAGLTSDTDAWVTFGSALGENNLAAAASTYTNCTISLARWQWRSRAEMEGDWGMFCLTVIHEVGHLLGREHSTGSRAVMAATFTSEANVPRACNATWLPGWR